MLCGALPEGGGKDRSEIFRFMRGIEMINDHVAALFAVVLMFTKPGPDTKEDVEGLLKTLTATDDAEAWQEAGQALLKKASSVASDDDAQFYLIIGGACLGHSIELTRRKHYTQFSSSVGPR